MKNVAKTTVTKMRSGAIIPHWSVYDNIKIPPTKPEALMAEINSAISSLEYSKSTKLLYSPPPLPKHKKIINNQNPNSNSSSSSSSSLYDARRADEAYKTGLASLAVGNLEEAFRSLNLALSKCPPNKTKAIAKLRSLINATGQRIRKSMS